MEAIPYWVCKKCGRGLDDHQLRALDGNWLTLPLCVEPGLIARGIRLPGGT